MNKCLVIGLLAVLAVNTASAARVGCYYGSWAVYRQGPGDFDAMYIDPTLCSHIIYSFAKVSSEGELQLYDDYNDVGDEWHIGQFTQLQKLREISPSTKLMIAVGGWNHGPGPFQAVVVDAGKRQKWVESTVAFLRKYNFDGLDIDWEYQDSVGGTPEQLEGFNEVLRMFRKRFDEEKLLLSIATAANFNLIEVNYDMKVLSETCDFINIMAYDLHGAWEKYTGHHSALHPLDYEEGYDRNLNVESVVKKYLERGADPAKINIGLPTYGRGFTLADPTNSSMYAPATGPSLMGAYVPEAGILGYDEICHNRWPERWEVQQAVPYAVSGNQWVGYETSVSIKGKMDYMKTLGVVNYFIWSVETDDFFGNCTGQPYPILRAINSHAALLEV